MDYYDSNFAFYVETSLGIKSPEAIIFYAIIDLLHAFIFASAFSKFTEIS